MTNIELIDDDRPITNCSDFGNYIRHDLIGKNWKDLKESTSLTKKIWAKRCCCKKGCRENSVAHDSDHEEELSTINNILFKPTAKQLTLSHMQVAVGVKNVEFIDDSLLYYLKLIFESKNEEIDYGFIDDLIKRGVNINYCDLSNENALFKAVQAEHEDLVTYLLDKNIHLTDVNTLGCTILHMTARNQSPTITRLIAEKLEKDNLDKFVNFKTYHEKQTPLHYAAKRGCIAVAESLITEYGGDKEAKDYRNRTPLYIAAEFNKKSMVIALMRLKCHVSFTDDTKKELLNNMKGQTTLFWIVTKMPDIAREALDQLYESNAYLRKDKHYLAPLEPNVIKTKQENGEYLPKSVIGAIVESDNKDLIDHPTIKCLIDIKWRSYARKNAWLDFILTVLNVLVWITFGVWIPYNMRHSYNLKNSDLDRFRLCLFIIGILFTIYLIFAELQEVYQNYRYQKISNNLRLHELEEYKKNTKEESKDNAFLSDEEILIKQNNFFKVLKDYLADIWNLYDWISVLLLVACIVTHVIDIFDHSEAKARLHIRIMSIAVIIIPLRLLKSSRIIIPKFGTLVMILYYAISDMIIWFVLYLVILLSYSCAFWMIYGGTKFTEDSNEDTQCFNVYNYNSSLCTTVSITEFERFDITAYYLYRITFGHDIDDSQLNSVDSQLSMPLLGLYIGLTSLVLVNIFIALLSATFNRVYEKAESYIIFQRAIEILNAEKGMSYEERKAHIKYIKKIGNPYIVRLQKEIITYTDDRLSKLENELVLQKNLLSSLEKKLEYTNLTFKHQNTKVNQALKPLELYEKKFEELLAKEKRIEELLLNFVNDYSVQMNSMKNMFAPREINQTNLIDLQMNTNDNQEVKQ